MVVVLVVVVVVVAMVVSELGGGYVLTPNLFLYIRLDMS